MMPEGATGTSQGWPGSRTTVWRGVGGVVEGAKRGWGSKASGLTALQGPGWAT